MSGVSLHVRALARCNKQLVQIPVLLTLLLASATAQFQDLGTGFVPQDLAAYFHQCRYTSPDFDRCMIHVLNQLNHLFPTGVPEYDIPPFDPFFASEVELKRENPLFRFRLRLTNVTESGWTNSKVTDFRSDLAQYRVTVQQHTPDKRLKGHYMFELSLLKGGVAIRNRGTFSLTLLDFSQELVFTRKPGEIDADGLPLVRIGSNIQDVRDMKIEITNLVFGHRILEYALDGIINFTWRPFYPLTKSLINELISTAFTPIFTRAFRYVPLEYFFPS